MGLEGGKGGAGRASQRRELKQRWDSWQPERSSVYKERPGNTHEQVRGHQDYWSHSSSDHIVDTRLLSQVDAGMADMERRLVDVEKELTQKIHKVGEAENEKFDLIFGILVELQSRQAQLEETVRALSGQLALLTGGYVPLGSVPTGVSCQGAFSGSTSTACDSSASVSASSNRSSVPGAPTSGCAAGTVPCPSLPIGQVVGVNAGATSPDYMTISVPMGCHFSAGGMQQMPTEEAEHGQVNEVGRGPAELPPDAEQGQPADTGHDAIAPPRKDDKQATGEHPHLPESRSTQSPSPTTELPATTEACNKESVPPVSSAPAEEVMGKVAHCAGTSEGAEDHDRICR